MKFAVAALCFTQLISVAHASDARVVVIADRASLGRKMATTLRLQLEKPLALRTGVVANNLYVRRALNMGYDQTDLAATDIAATVGAEVDATHVLVLTGKKRRRRRALLTATLVDVRTGATSEVTTVRVKKRLRKGSSSRVIAGVMEQMEHATPEAPEPVAAVTSVPAIADDGSFDGALPSWAESSVRRTVPDAEPPHHDRDALALRIAPSAVAFLRECAIRTRDSAEAVRHYRTEDFIPGLGLDVEVFPFTFDTDESALDNVGLHARGFASQVASSVPGSDARAVSTVWSAEGDITYRAEPRNWSVAPSMVLRVGYGAFAFPVASEEFPSLMYAGPRGSLRLALTVGGVFVLFAEGGYLHPIQVGGDASSIGRLKTSGTHAYHGEAGLAVRFGWFELGAAARLERFSLAFAGTARLAGVGELYDGRVDDRVISGSAWIGLAL